MSLFIYSFHAILTLSRNMPIYTLHLPILPRTSAQFLGHLFPASDCLQWVLRWLPTATLDLAWRNLNYKYLSTFGETWSQTRQNRTQLRLRKFFSRISRSLLSEKQNWQSGIKLSRLLVFNHVLSCHVLQSTMWFSDWFFKRLVTTGFCAISWNVQDWTGTSEATGITATVVQLSL